MAVSALPRTHARAPSLGGVHPAVLLVSLVAPALDLLAIVQTHAALPMLTLAWCGLAAVLLGITWLRHPREAWLAAAALSMAASGALRLVEPSGATAPLLSLLGIVALGIGGAFASPSLDLDLIAADA
jgi:hypothetical protein